MSGIKDPNQNPIPNRRGQVYFDMNIIEIILKKK